MSRGLNRIRHPAKRAFLAAYRQTGNIRRSTEAARVDRTTYYVWCERDAEFAAAARIAKEEYGDLLEAKLGELAIDFSNATALIVALKMAGRFVEKTQTEVSGPHGGPIQIDAAERERRLAALAELSRIR
jgi:hypothetical protein